MAYYEEMQKLEAEQRELDLKNLVLKWQNEAEVTRRKLYWRDPMTLEKITTIEILEKCAKELEKLL